MDFIIILPWLLSPNSFRRIISRNTNLARWFVLMKQYKLGFLIQLSLDGDLQSLFINFHVTYHERKIAIARSDHACRGRFFSESANFFPRCVLQVVGFLFPLPKVAMLERCDHCPTPDLQEHDSNVKGSDSYEENGITENKTENCDARGMFINFSSDMSDGGFKTKRKYKRAYKVNGVNILNR